MLQVIPYSWMRPTRISYFNCTYRNAIDCHYWLNVMVHLAWVKLSCWI